MQLNKLTRVISILGLIYLLTGVRVTDIYAQDWYTSARIGEDTQHYKVLVTAFEPFGGKDTNVTEDLLAYLPKESPTQHATIITEVLPVVYEESGALLREAIQEHQPDIVISLGESRFKGELRIDTLAANKIRSNKKDNNEHTYKGRSTVLGGEETLPNLLASEELVNSLTSQGINVFIKDTATTYVCNHLFYHLMDEVYHYPERHQIKAAGFVHVERTTLPLEIEQRAEGVMALIDSQINEIITN